MDPITVVGFLAAVVQLIDVTSKVVNYFNDVKNAPKDRGKLAREATGLLALFTDLRYRVEETTSTDPWFIGLRSLGEKGGPLREFNASMNEIADKLAPATTGVVNLKRVLRWTLDKNEINAILTKIERLKTLIALALQNDHFKLSLAMKEDITVGFREIKTNRDVEKINQWLAAPLPSSNHNAAMKKRQPSTGDWFIQSKEFAEWKIGTSSFIWLHGIPGCGKTILCSTIIQDVISYYRSEPTIAVAYFYFDFNDIEKQRTEMFIRSLIVQFAAQCPNLPESLQSAHSRSQGSQEQPAMGEMTSVLHQMLKNFNTTYILLDALDECTDRQDLLDFIEVLMGWKISSLHVLATSRKENDIIMSLESLITCQLSIQSASVDADIRLHILERLSNDPRLKRLPAVVQSEIHDNLMKGANGMFRWVVCQLDSLRKCLTLDVVRKTLETLPKTLDDTYGQILSNLDEDYKENASRIFQWLCFSKRPMRLDEMVDVLATDSISGSSFRPEARLLDPRDILTICSTLVNVTTTTENDSSTETQELRLAHFSVKEYLISDRLKETPMYHYHITPLSANVSMAQTCLTYLLHFGSPIFLTAEFDLEFPFIRYAAEFWPWHYRNITDDADREVVDSLGSHLVNSRNYCFINWLRIFNPERTFNLDVNLETMRIPSPLYYMSYLGVSGVVQLLLNQKVDVNAQGGRFVYALSAASLFGHEQVARLLLENGANPNAEGNFLHGHVLSAASSNGHEKMVQLLLEKGANVNAKGGFFGTALSAASYYGHEKMVQLLLEKGAKVNAKGGFYRHALTAASFCGHEKVVRILLENGASVNAEGGPRSCALEAASCGGHEKTVRLLVEKGADVNTQRGVALREAFKQKKEMMLRFLLEYKADARWAFCDHFKLAFALQRISVDDHEAVMEVLLKELSSAPIVGAVRW